MISQMKMESMKQMISDLQELINTPPENPMFSVNIENMNYDQYLLIQQVIQSWDLE